MTQILLFSYEGSFIVIIALFMIMKEFMLYVKVLAHRRNIIILAYSHKGGDRGR